MNKVSEYNGYPVIVLNVEDDYPLSYGKTKCKLIIDNIHRIRGHIAIYTHDVCRRMKKDDTPVPPVELPNGQYDPFRIGLWACRVIAENFKDIERFYNTGEL